jgi:hypothetical protein
VGAWFQGNIDGGLLQQWFVFGAHGCKGIHFGMTFTAADMIALSNDSFSITRGRRADYHSTYHRIRACLQPAIGSQLDAASHVFLVFSHHVFYLSVVGTLIASCKIKQNN